MKSRNQSRGLSQRIDNIDIVDMIDSIDYSPRPAQAHQHGAPAGRAHRLWCAARRVATHFCNPMRQFRPPAARQGRRALPLNATGWGRAGVPFGCDSRPAPRRRSGFTVIELLGVILTLATLFALILPAVKLSLRTAQKRQAGAEATALAQAVLHYRQTYGYWPGVDAAAISEAEAQEPHTLLALDDDDRPAWAAPGFPGWNGSIPLEHTDIIKALIPSEDNEANPRRIRFLDIPDSRFDGEGRFLDPWGTPYVLVIHPPHETAVSGATPEPGEGPSIGGRPVGWGDVVAFSFGPPGRVRSKEERDAGISPTAANLIFSAGVPR